MAGEELIVRMGLDPTAFRQGMAEQRRAVDDTAAWMERESRERHNREQARARERHDTLMRGFRTATVAAAAATAALAKVWDEYAKRSDAAARSMAALKQGTSDLLADVGRDIFGGARVGERIADRLGDVAAARRGVSDFLGAGYKTMGSLVTGDPVSPFAAWRDVREQDRLLREDENIDRRMRAMGTMRRESVGFIGDDRARAIEEALLDAAEALKRVADDKDLSDLDKYNLAESIKAARDEQIRRLERTTDGSMDAAIYGAEDQVAALRSAMARANEQERIDIESRLAAAMERLAVLMATRAARDDVSLTDAQVRERIDRARIEAGQQRDLVEAGIFARERERRARESEQRRLETERARVSVRDQLAENDIGILEAGGDDLEARRLAIALRYRQTQETIAARTDLSAEQRQALLDSSKSLFEAQFAALGNGQRQQTLSAGSGILADSAFSGPGPMLNVQKSMDRSLKSIDAKMSDLQSLGTLR